MSYSSSGDPGVAKVESVIYDLIEAFKETGDPMFYRVNPACFRWLSEAIEPYGFEVKEKQGNKP